MTVILTHDCPRCGRDNLGFSYLGKTSVDSDRHLEAAFFQCSKCNGPVTVFLYNYADRNVQAIKGDIKDAADIGVHIIRIEPATPKPSAPEHTPPVVAEYYVEACDSLHRGKWTSAAGMLRKCMEVALKQFAPDVEAWKLEKRIDKLAAEHLITPALRDWAHELRLDGNEALHGTEPATEELATRMERLTHFLLVYLYTLPAQVEQARAARENGN